jgi:serine/threonine protein kinase
MSTPSYKILSKKGQGGMAEVFKAVKSGPDGFSKTVALKRILPLHSDQSQFIRMLSTEAKIHSYLSHPNIVQILDFFEEDGQYSMVLEYVDGKNLKELLNICKQKNLTLPWQACLLIMMEILKGLHYAHTKDGPDGPLNIVHRDVSPHNILISYEGEVKLSDFGIARAKIQRDETASGVLKGKYRYLSPEQVLNDKISASSDIFSAGVTLYEMISLEHPFGQHQEYQTLQKILDQPHIPLKQLVPLLNPEISEIIDRALQKNQQQRFLNAREFYDQLLEIQDSSWITHGSELLSTLLQGVIPEEEKKEDLIEKTSVLAKPIVKHQSLLQKSSPPYQKSFAGKMLMVVFAIVFIPIGMAYLIAKKNPPLKAEPVVATIKEQKTQKVPPIKPKVPQKTTIAKPQGTIIISGPANTHIYINGKSMGYLPISEQVVPEGSYSVLMDRGDKGRQMKKVQVVRKEITQIAWE